MGCAFNVEGRSKGNVMNQDKRQFPQPPSQQPQGGAQHQDKGGGQQQDKGRAGDKPGMDKGKKQSPDQGLVGQDTDGDGKVVQPGQRPGQSHGHGLDKK
jgi:hypothetical protein